MNEQNIKDMIACLGDERRLFYYHKDRYCFDLLRYELQKNTSLSGKISQLKQSQFGHFLNKNTVKNALAGYGNGEISTEQLASCWFDKPLMFTLTLACWGEGDRGWDQTSRNQSNLVLQINFTGEHLDAYRKLVKPEDFSYGPFESFAHPINDKGRHTMAWVRIDFDLDTNEALIEEVQNDWLREANSALKQLEEKRKKHPNAKPNQVWWDIGGDYAELAEYVQCALKPYQQIWAEASLTAAIQLIREELGITTIYYHTYETGKKIKDICSDPPRSMYTKLPKQFGFKRTTVTPRFLMKDKVSRRYLRAIKQPEWFVMEL